MTRRFIHRARLAARGLNYRREPDVSALDTDGRRFGAWISRLDTDGGRLVVQLRCVHLKSGCAWNALDGRKTSARHATLAAGTA